MTREEILVFLTDHKAEMAERFGVTSLGIAGSIARGDATENSDIDIIVDLQSRNKFRSFFGLLHYLQDALPHKIDLATEASLKPLVREQVMKDIRYV
ncbi:MAG: nucleotidyltransferase family protein [Desulfuromonadales bacterium]|nr:nucleotidyltransferase family protein [Desulfuromonadales bacterium]